MRIKNTSENKTFYATAKSAGFDISSTEEYLLEPGEFRAFGTGLYLDKYQGIKPGSDTSKLVVCWADNDGVLEEGPDLTEELQIRPRSGLAFKYGVTVLNAPGTVDLDYPDEIKVILINHHRTNPFLVEKGMRIAQGVVALVTRAAGDVEIQDNTRTGGFGSTGSKS
jgi:dUTP pyrophosphatase